MKLHTISYHKAKRFECGLGITRNIPCRAQFIQCQAIAELQLPFQARYGTSREDKMANRISISFHILTSNRYQISRLVITSLQVEKKGREKRQKRGILDGKGHFLTRKRGNNRNPGRVYYTRIRSLDAFSSPSSLCQAVLFVAVATPISKTFHLFLTVPLIILQRASVLLSFFYKARNFLDTIVRRNFSLRSDTRKFLLK